MLKYNSWKEGSKSDLENDKENSITWCNFCILLLKVDDKHEKITILSHPVIIYQSIKKKTVTYICMYYVLSILESGSFFKA